MLINFRTKIFMLLIVVVSWITTPVFANDLEPLKVQDKDIDRLETYWPSTAYVSDPSYRARHL